MGRRWAPTIDYFSHVINDLPLEQWPDGGRWRLTISFVVVNDFLLEEQADEECRYSTTPLVIVNCLLLEQWVDEGRRNHWSNHYQRPSAGTMGNGGHRRPTTSLVIVDSLLKQWSEGGHQQSTTFCAYNRRWWAPTTDCFSVHYQ